MTLKRIAVALVLTGVPCLSGITVAQARAQEPHADEMSSVEWRDCAGHFFFLASALGAEGQKEMVKQFNSMALMAVYASETKAKAEAAAGTTSNGLGKSIADPKSGKLNVDVEAMRKDHQAKAQAQGQEPYVQAYAKKCGQPVMAYSKRFMENAQSSGE